jgi:hypothetical protein
MKEQERREKTDRVKTPAACRKTKKGLVAPAPRKSTGANNSPGPSTSSSKTPKTSSQVSLRKSILSKAASRGETLNDEIDSADDSEPVQYGPQTKMEQYKAFIEQQKNANKQIQRIAPDIPEQIVTTNVALENELHRTHRDLTPNSTVVDAIQDQEINIGNRLVSAMAAENPEDVIRDSVAAIANEFSDLMLHFTPVSKTAGRSLAQETLNKLNAIKNQATVRDVEYEDPREVSRKAAILEAVQADDDLENVEADFGDVSGKFKIDAFFKFYL